MILVGRLWVVGVLIDGRVVGIDGLLLEIGEIESLVVDRGLSANLMALNDFVGYFGVKPKPDYVLDFGGGIDAREEYFLEPALLPDNVSVHMTLLRLLALAYGARAEVALVVYPIMYKLEFMAYVLSQDQVEALRQIGAWYRSRSKPFLTLGGYAGTGKTTLVAYLRKALRDHDDGARVGFCAYTGKAARVLADRLRQQGVTVKGDSVGTIHLLIYDTEEAGGGGVRWVRKEAVERDLIVVDEASMVDEAIWRDLLSFGVPVLAVGDHGQLPPVGSSFNLMAEPMVRLDRIWRQEAESPIIEVATLARESGMIPVGEFGAGVRKLNRALPETGVMVEEFLESWRPDLLILCGYNATRIKLNQAIRAARGMESAGPQSGDAVVCLRNNRAKRIYNGMVGRIVRAVPTTADDGTDWYELEVELEGEDYRYYGYGLREQFGAETTVSDLPIAPGGERGDLWDFGYALTVHKAQGSQAERVLVFEERFAKASEEDWRRWLYTAVTRAQVELTVVGPAVSGED